MLNALPSYIGVVFILTTFLSVWFLYKATNYNKSVALVLLIWLLVQGFVALSGFYTHTDALPPRFVFLAPPTIIVILLLFVTQKGRVFIDSIDLKTLTYLHVIRIPVEMVLLWLFMYNQVPQLMTFEGRNYDILSGLSAPIVGYLAFTKKTISPKLLLVWNIACLILLINIVANAVLSVPSPIQMQAFDQPAVGILYFPFVWLPCCVVPIVLFAHLVAIRQLLAKP